MKRPTIESFRVRESVRSTFNLSQRAHEAKSDIATFLNTTQKEAVEEVCDLMFNISQSDWERHEKKYPPSNRVRKTHVLSRGALNDLEEGAARLGTDRNRFFEVGLLVYRDLIDAAFGPAVEKARDEIEEFTARGFDLYDSLRERFGPSKMIDSLVGGMFYIENALEDIEGTVDEQLAYQKALANKQSDASFLRRIKYLSREKQMEIIEKLEKKRSER